MRQINCSVRGKEIFQYIFYWYVAATAAKLLQSCPILCNPIDGSSSGSPVPGVLQARTLEWVAISFSNAWKWKAKVKSLSRARLLATPWTAAYQAPPSTGFSRQEYWSGSPLPSPIDLLLLLAHTKKPLTQRLIWWKLRLFPLHAHNTTILRGNHHEQTFGFFFPEVILYVFANIERYIFKSKIRVYLEKSF